MQYFFFIAILSNWFPLSNTLHISQSEWPQILVPAETATRSVQCKKVFFCEFCEISKNTFFKEHLWTTSYMPASFWINSFNLERTSLSLIVSGFWKATLGGDSTALWDLGDFRKWFWALRKSHTIALKVLKVLEENLSGCC